MATLRHEFDRRNAEPSTGVVTLKSYELTTIFEPGGDTKLLYITLKSFISNHYWCPIFLFPVLKSHGKHPDMAIEAA